MGRLGELSEKRSVFGPVTDARSRQNFQDYSPSVPKIIPIKRSSCSSPNVASQGILCGLSNSLIDLHSRRAAIKTLHANSLSSSLCFVINLACES